MTQFINPQHWLGAISSLKRPIANLTPRSLYFLDPSPDLGRGYLQTHLLIETKKRERNAFIFKALQSKPPTLFWDTLSGCKEKHWKQVLQIVSSIKFYNKISYYLLWFYHRTVNNGQNTASPIFWFSLKSSLYRAHLRTFNNYLLSLCVIVLFIS